MKSITELISDTIDQVLPHGTPEEKKKRAEELRKSLERGKPITATEAGVTPEAIHRLHAFAFQLYNNGRYKEAHSIYAVLATMDANNYDFAFGFAACLHMLKQYRGAADAYMRASQLDVTNPTPFFHLADCYMELKDTDKAIIALSFAEQISGDELKYAELKRRAGFTKERLLQHKSETGKKPEENPQKSHLSAK